MNIFKQEEKKPFTYASIEVKKSTRSYTWQIVIATVTVLTVTFLFGAKII